MGCGNCSSGGCSSSAGCGSNGSCGTCSVSKLDVFNWLAGMELPFGQKSFDIVEVYFKNTRKEFFRNSTGLELTKGEPIVVESASGYDIGRVNLTGELVRFQMQKRGEHPSGKDLRKIIRKPSQEDLDKWHEARELEKETMLRSRLISKEQKLQMKISDVEYQADRTKATFYYTADERVDFRSLIRVLADQFKVRIEMRQIGARQEAGRLGGIGSCGRELCCSTWLTDFRSVSTSAARYQQLSINPLKLAGQCGKLKCCLNYELDSYLDALKNFPDANTKLDTKKGRSYHVKSDIFKQLMWFNYAEEPSKFICLHIDRVKEILEMNGQGQKPQDLEEFQEQLEPLESTREPDIENVVGQDSLTRFDKELKQKKRRKPSRKKGNAPQKGTSQKGDRPVKAKKKVSAPSQKAKKESGGQKTSKNNQRPKGQGQNSNNKKRKQPNTNHKTKPTPKKEG